MDKKKRSKCETSHRKVFIVNEANPKEKVIFDFLSTLYTEADIVKDILYDYIISNNLQTAQHSVSIVPTLGKHSVSNTAETCNASVSNGINVCADGVSNSIANKQENISKDDFNINLDDIEDKVIKVGHDPEVEIKQANNNALDFLKTGF